ncbi:MAG: DNA primase [Myxococcota bacterium]
MPHASPSETSDFTKTLGSNPVQRVKERVDVAGVIGRYVRLRKRGRNLVGLCPFHGEKTPSFYVHPQEGFFKCFGCGAGGDILAFLQRQTGQPFIEVLEQLAGEVGVALPRRARDDAAQELRDVLKRAQEFFSSQLKGGDHNARGAPASRIGAQDLSRQTPLGALRGRGVSAEHARRWSLGYCPSDSRVLGAWLHQQGISEQLAARAGLARATDRGARPFFGGRITIALRDARDRIVGFAARSLQSSDRSPKYLNSPASPLYQKSAFLYGLPQALPLLRQGKPAVVAEGYFDVIALRELGHAAVCAGGTSFSAAHAARLARYAKEVVLCLDGDDAGRTAGQKVLPLLLRAGFCVRDAALPQGDPADWWATGKAEQLDALLREAPDALETLIRQAARQPAPTPAQRLRRLDVLLPFLASPARALLVRQYVRLAASLLGEDEAILRQEVAAFLKRDGIRGTRRVDSRPLRGFAPRGPAGACPRDQGPWKVSSSARTFQGREGGGGNDKSTGCRALPCHPRESGDPGDRGAAGKPLRPVGAESLSKQEGTQSLLLRLVLAYPQLALQCRDALLEQTHPLLRQFVREVACRLAQEQDADPHDVLKRLPIAADSPLLPLLLRVRRDKSSLTLDEAQSILRQWHARAAVQQRRRQNEQKRRAQAAEGAPADVRALWEDTVALHELHQQAREP